MKLPNPSNHFELCTLISTYKAWKLNKNLNAYPKLTVTFTLWHLVGPHADTGFAVVGETGGTLVPGGLSVPAVPEDVALGVVGEDAVEAFTVWGADCRF